MNYPYAYKFFRHDILPFAMIKKAIASHIKKYQRERRMYTWEEIISKDKAITKVHYHRHQKIKKLHQTK